MARRSPLSSISGSAALAVLVTLCWSAIAAAQDPAPLSGVLNEPAGDRAARVAAMLEIAGGSYRDTASRDAAYQRLMEFASDVDTDPRVGYARLLATIELKKVAEAQKLGAALSDEQPDYLPARVQRLRLLLIAAKHADAFADLESLIRRIGEPVQENVSAEQQRSAAAFAGVATAYFEGPAADLLKGARTESLERAVGAWPSDLRSVFEEARIRVAEEYGAIAERGEAALAELRQQKKEQDESAAALREQLQSQRAQTEQVADQTRQQLAANAQDLRGQHAAVSEQFGMVQTQINQLRAQQLLIQSAMTSLPRPLPDANGNVHPGEMAAYQAELARLRFAAQTLAPQLAQLNLQAQRLRVAGASLEGRFGEVQAESQRLGQTLAREEQQLRKLDETLRIKEKTAKDPKKTAAQLRRERSFATYDDYSFQREKEQLLGSFAE